MYVGIVLGHTFQMAVAVLKVVNYVQTKTRLEKLFPL